MRTTFLSRAAPLAAALALSAGVASATGADDMSAAMPATGFHAATPGLAALDAPELPAGPDAPVAQDATPPTLAFGTAVTIERLAAMRGADGTTTTNRADVRGTVGGNTATNVIGGGNLIADGSFGAAAGISTVIQNSGSNVLIQNSTIVNVQFVPTP